ncbi:transmembrane protein 272-like [Haplochromis burtoni]|uniref:transmembrane protein 272-like n=1 Tax=Haplochromis burtoni TaxID=8153 RepID=UPI001C2DE4C4|nr:transmembrane protein 272-like [Haplochromis burtoni]
MESSYLLGRIRNRPKPPATALAIFSAIFCIMPIAQIAIGAIYLHECPRQHYIPIYLIVLGLSSLLFVLLSCFPCAKEPEEGTSNPLSTIYKAWNSLAMFFVFCWFIAGDVWIYSIYQPNYDKNTTNVDPYCNKTLYLFAFWINTLFNISVGFFFLGVFLFLLGFCLYRGANPAADV